MEQPQHLQGASTQKKPPIILSNGQIDIHGRAKTYQQSLANLEKSHISAKNKALIKDFLRDCELGKTLPNRASKRLGELRMAKVCSILKQVAEWLGEDFDKVKQKGMEEFILRFERDQITQSNGKIYKPETKLGMKKILIKFYKWLLGDNRTVPPIVAWIDLTNTTTEIPSLTIEEVRRLVAEAGKLRTKCLVMFLFDSGARLEETLNIKLKHVTLEKDYYRVRIPYSKTKPRTISVPLCTDLLEAWLRKHPQKEDSEAPLFNITPRVLWKTLKDLAFKAGINKRISAHVLRHSSATYYCNKLSHYQFCYRYGWAMSSDMPQRYIDRQGVNDVAADVVKNDSVARLSEENFTLKQELNLLKDRVSSLDNVMTTLLSETPEAANLLRKVAVKKGLLEELRKHAD